MLRLVEIDQQIFQCHQCINFHYLAWFGLNCTDEFLKVVRVAYFCHHLSENYVDLSYFNLDLSVIYEYVDLSDHYVDLSENHHQLVAKYLIFISC